MAKPDDIPNLTLEVLRAIRKELTDLREDTRTGFAHLTGRFDHFIAHGGDWNRALDERVTRLEQHVFGK